MAAPEYKLQIHEGVAQIPAAQWNKLAGASASPFLEWEWLASLEEAGCVAPETGWRPMPLTLHNKQGELAAAMPLYLKGHSEGEFVFDWGWAEAAERAGIAYYPKLLVGVPFTPVRGARVLTAPETTAAQRTRIITTFAQALKTLCEQNRLSGAHINFCLEDERRALARAGFAARLGLQYHWQNPGFTSFEEYLNSLRSKRRNQSRRELRSLEEQKVTVEKLYGDEIGDELFAPMYNIYLQTIRENPWGRQYLNRRFFELLRERFRRRMCFIAAKQGSEIIAGTVNVQKGGALYGRYWGAFKPLRNLHFNVCYYAGIQHCIAHKLSRFEPGAGGAYKHLRGFEAVETCSCHYLAHPQLAHAVAEFLKRERRAAQRTIKNYARFSAHKREGA